MKIICSFVSFHSNFGEEASILRLNQRQELKVTGFILDLIPHIDDRKNISQNKRKLLSLDTDIKRN